MRTAKAGVALMLLVGSLFSGTLMAEPLGTLFFTPGQRMELERMRWRSLDHPEESKPERIEANPSAGAFADKPVSLTLSGTVRRSGGAPVIWLNGVSCRGKEFPEYVRLPGSGTGGQIVVRVPEEGRAHLLKPGQTLDVVSGQVQATYERAGGGETDQGGDAAGPSATRAQGESLPLTPGQGQGSGGSQSAGG